MSLDSLLWIASCTKLLTAISTLQLVERGLISLDQPLSSVLTEFKPPIPMVSPYAQAGGLPIVTSTDEPLTLRRLLTHTSGIGYEHAGAILEQWRQTLPESSAQHSSKIPRNRTITLDYLYPLLFQPGALGKWEYGAGVDWAGQVVERVNPEGLTLGPYMEKYIWGPLGMKDTTFRPRQNTKLAQKLIQRVERLDDGGIALDPMERFPHIDPVDESGGGGLYSTSRDYIKVLESLLLDDGRLLSSEMVSELFRPQLPDSPDLQEKLAFSNDAEVLTMETDIVGPHIVKWNYGLGGLVAMDNIPGKGKAGIMTWSGLPCCFWWVDRTNGTAGFYGSQMWPPWDEQTRRLCAKFQKGICDLQTLGD